MLPLLPHKDTGAGPVGKFTARGRVDTAGRLSFRYLIACDPENLDLGGAGAARKGGASREDELWKSTCFEAFLRPAGGREYIELNFSPENKWAAYSFTDYREGMTNIDLLDPPDINVEIGDDFAEIRAELQIPEKYAGEKLDMAIAAVILDAGGNIAYWSLAHPGGKPDFHHNSCFAAKLAPPVFP